MEAAWGLKLSSTSWAMLVDEGGWGEPILAEGAWVSRRVMCVEA